MAESTHHSTKSPEEDSTSQSTSLKSPPDPLSPNNEGPSEDKDPVAAPRRGFKFWIVIVSLCVTSLLAALEGTVTSTALPKIVEELNVGDNYPWVANAYFLTTACFQPFFGQTSDIFGRRYPMIACVVIFTLGSGIAGGANDTAMLLAGRTVQGIGGGGINMFIELIVCDLVPLRERGIFMSLIFAVFAIGTSLGPFIGGLFVTKSSWRWVFYINLPVGGAALILLVLFLQVNYDKETTVKEKMKRIDWAGNVLLCASIIAVLIALSWGGARYPWVSANVLVPLILGLVGIALFVVFEASPFVKEPTTPLHLFGNRTSAVGFFLTFTHGLLSFWILYMLPIYFQAVKRSSPLRSGVQLLPTVVALIPLSVVSGALLTKIGKYRNLHILGFALFVLGLGLFQLLDEQSSTAEWAVFQIIAAAGSGIVLPILLPAIQAPLSEGDVATSTATWAFIRSFGIVWGLSIPAAIFNNQFSKHSYLISDPIVRDKLGHGDAYSYASSELINSYPASVQREVISVYEKSLKVVWQVSLAFAGLAFLLTFLEKDIALRKELETEYGLKEGEQKEENSDKV